jgi:hypothetical protein
MTTAAVANVETQTVAFAGTTYDIRPLAPDTFTVLIEGVPVGRIVYTFGAANGVPESDSTVSEDTLSAVAEAWFAAVDG